MEPGTTPEDDMTRNDIIANRSALYTTGNDAGDGYDYELTDIDMQDAVHVADTDDDVTVIDHGGHAVLVVDKWAVDVQITD